MKFMMTFDWAPDTEVRAEGIERFQAAGGVGPEGVQLLGRWTRADLSGGFALLETDDPKKLAEFAFPKTGVRPVIHTHLHKRSCRAPAQQPDYP